VDEPPPYTVSYREREVGSRGVSPLLLRMERNEKESWEEGPVKKYREEDCPLTDGPHATCEILGMRFSHSAGVEICTGPSK
jgi:hypothetical protein